MANVINMGGGGTDLVSGTIKAGTHLIYSDGESSYDETPSTEKSVPVLGNSIVYAPAGLSGGATALDKSGFWFVTDDFVTLSNPATASTSPKSGVTYTNGISDLDAETLSKFAAAISNNSEITFDTETVYCDFSSLHRKISVGDLIPIPLDNKIYSFVLIGFNHDDLETASYYGSVTFTGKAGMCFEITEPYKSDTGYPMCTEGNLQWYPETDMCKTTLPGLLATFPSDWKSRIPTVIKKCTTDSPQGSDYSPVTKDYPMKVFQLSLSEAFNKYPVLSNESFSKYVLPATSDELCSYLVEGSVYPYHKTVSTYPKVTSKRFLRTPCGSALYGIYAGVTKIRGVRIPWSSNKGYFFATVGTNSPSEVEVTDVSYNSNTPSSEVPGIKKNYYLPYEVCFAFCL